MPTQNDLKKEWEKTRTQLARLSKEAVKIAKRGEQELVKLSRKSKLHVDTTAIALRKERLYYLIGKEYANTKDQQPSPKMKQFLSDLNKAEKEQQAVNRQLKTGKKVKKST